MVAQAKAELPNECCGLLAGLVDQSKVGRVLQRYPLVNNAASPTEYLANDRTLFHAYRDMRERDVDLLAVYHSHPVRGWWLGENDYREAEWELAASDRS